ncbi:unnamed protein product [Staurois parvus]|uniref:Uncharacterized protein n=1 Tax=Staurois parvus TaxID=386267 RepID=A0ABN9DEH3_9NEOB|nr:unnamed protein product [Staurois parvus]
MRRRFPPGGPNERLRGHGPCSNEESRFGGPMASFTGHSASSKCGGPVICQPPMDKMEPTSSCEET